MATGMSTTRSMMDARTGAHMIPVAPPFSSHRCNDALIDRVGGIAPERKAVGTIAGILPFNFVEEKFCGDHRDKVLARGFQDRNHLPDRRETDVPLGRSKFIQRRRWDTGFFCKFLHGHPLSPQFLLEGHPEVGGEDPLET